MKQPAKAFAATARVDTDSERRPPVLNATRALGLADHELARAFGISAMAVSHWATEQRPIPLTRHLALLFVIGRLLGAIDAAHPPATKYARRMAVAHESARQWAELSKLELYEQLGGDPPEDAAMKAMKMGMEAVARLEAREAS